MFGLYGVLFWRGQPASLNAIRDLFFQVDSLSAYGIYVTKTLPDGSEVYQCAACGAEFPVDVDDVLDECQHDGACGWRLMKEAWANITNLGYE